MAYNPYQPGQHPFWQFVTAMDAESRRPPSYAPRDRWENEQAAEAEASNNNASKKESKDKGKSKQPSVEDEVMNETEASPSKRGLVDTEKPTEKKTKSKEEERHTDSSDEERRWGRHHHRRGGPRGMHRHGPPPFGRGAFGSPGFGPEFGAFGPDFGFDFSDWTPPHHRPGPPSPEDHRGPPPPGFQRPPPPPGLGPHHHRPPHPPHPEHCGPEFRGRHGCRRGGRRGGPFGREFPGGFNVPGFLNDLGARIGVDLNAAAAHLGLDLSRLPGGRGDSDFVPPHDLFDLPNEYLLHVSLPGARREDLGLDFEGENNTLRVAGVVYRPDVDEQTTQALSHSGRSHQVGVFETKIRLPKKDEYNVDVNAISAKLRDGILVIHVPKLPVKKDEKRTIRINTPSPSPSPERPSSLPVREKEQPTTEWNEKSVEPRTEQDLYEATPRSETEKGDDHDDDVMHDDPPEELPAYTTAEDISHHHAHAEEHDSSDDDAEEDEGEYVKINVD